MREEMTFEEAKAVLGGLFFCAYYGPGYTWRNAIEEMCARHPQGEQGLKGAPLADRKIFKAAFRIKQELSNPKTSFGKRTKTTRNWCGSSNKPNRQRANIATT